MARPIAEGQLRLFGRIDTRPNEETAALASSRASCRCSWRPAGNLWKDVLKAGSFPLVLEMDCDLGADGIRRFTPPRGGIAIVMQSAILGSAILDRLGRTKPGNDAYEASAIQLWSNAPNLRELFGRRFKRHSDLDVSQKARGDHTDVLPDRLGIPYGRDARRWTVARLLRVGKEAATRERLPLSQETCIQCGLYESAKLDPVIPSKLTKTNVRGMLRQGLFDLGPSHAGLDRGTRRLVLQRFIETARRHGALSDEEFQRWMNEDFNNIVHQISKRKTSGGTLDRAIVRQAIVEETFDAYFAVGHAMDVGMRTFAASLDEPLAPMEKHLFSCWYYAQPWLGGLTLMMLHGQFALLRPAIIGVLNEPRSIKARGALIRLLLYYGEMTSKRREADRRAKQLALARNVSGRSATFDSSRVDTLRSRPEWDERVNSLVDRLVADRRPTCNCAGTGRWRMASVEGQQVTLLCERCSAERIIVLTETDIQELRCALLNQAEKNCSGA
jgi:hypothetical protein